MMGNKNKAITNHGPALAEARAVRQPAFDVVRALNPPNPFFPWKKISKLPRGGKKDMEPTQRHALPTFTKTPQNLAQSIMCLQHTRWYEFFPAGKATPQTTKDHLLVAFKTLRGAICQHAQEEAV